MHNQSEIAPTDTGLQPQRTVLSWFRTIAVVFLNALLLIKLGLYAEQQLLLCAGIFLLILATMMYAYNIQRNQIIHLNHAIVSNRTVLIHKITSVSIATIALILFVHNLQNLFNLSLG